MEVAVQTYWESTQQTAVVTGAAHPAGIGFGIAEALASCGMDVVIMDLPSTPLGESSAKLQENYGVRVLPVPIDITSDQDVEKAVEQVRRFTPTVHALVNNAGIMPASARLGEMDEGTWSKVLDINLGGPFKMIRKLLPMMQRGSSIVNIASRAGKRPSPGYSAYSVSKAALIMLTKCFAVEYAAEGIRANAICPGQIYTELNKARFEREAAEQGISLEARVARMVETIPFGRMGAPEDVGHLVAFLVSPESEYITGQAFNICGGQLTEL